MLAMDAERVESDESMRSNGEIDTPTSCTGSDRFDRITLHNPASETMEVEWPAPDMGVLRLHRRPPPNLPIKYFGEAWGKWIVDAAAAASCPSDYVAAPLLATASALIGNARWPQAIKGGWKEPPHLWLGVLGDSGDGKSPGSDCLMREIVPVLENRMRVDFPDQLREWQAGVECREAAQERWKKEVREAEKNGRPPPLPPVSSVSAQKPESPRFVLIDTTIEKMAYILSRAAPKGLLSCRDELSGWMQGLNAYNPQGRAFWVQSYGGRPYSQDRVKHGQEPIRIPQHAVALYGGVQPEKLGEMMRGADDGLLARMLWSWPDPVEFRIGLQVPNVEWAIAALDRLRELTMQPGSDAPEPILVLFEDEARKLLEAFGRDMQKRRDNAGGLLRSAYGKTRGHAMRLACVLAFLWWSADSTAPPPPLRIGAAAFAAAATLLEDYFLPMAQRTYGDASLSERERDAATLARWIYKERPTEVHAAHLYREVRLPNLTTAAKVRAASDTLAAEADWLREPPRMKGFGTGRARVAYIVNPRIYE